MSLCASDFVVYLHVYASVVYDNKVVNPLVDFGCFSHHIKCPKNVTMSLQIAGWFGRIAI